MSIVPLQRVTLVGHVDDKARVLDRLQDLGCLHVLPATAEAKKLAPQRPEVRPRQALEFLLSCPQQRRQMTDPRRFDPLQVEQEALELRRRLLELRDERDFLKRRIADLEAWGHFELPELADLAGQRMWFYVVPPYHLDELAATGVVWSEVHRDNRNHYVVVLSDHQPEGMPVPRTRTGTIPLEALRERLDEVEFALEDLEAERSSLTRWCTLLARNLDRLDDRAERDHVASQTADVPPVFALLAWAPQDRIGQLEQFALEAGLAVERHDPRPEDDPPTLLENAPLVRSGEQLVTFYMTPSYFSWDPSSVVFGSFLLFFAMILSDAGYALVMALILARLWPGLATSDLRRRMRVLFAGLTLATLFYGVLAGSYFGLAPAPGSWLADLRVLDLDDSDTMMALAVVIGGLHLIAANLLDARRWRGHPRALASLGWVGVLVGGLVAGAGVLLGSVWSQGTGLVVLAAGGVLVLSFAGAGQRPLRRIVQGGLALTNATKAFGDVLSYLRLFALGLATASLAVSFNDMGARIRDSVPGVGLLLALLVWIVGHSLNFVLGLASGVIHGLRLNVIEFLDWSLHDEGKIYRPFERREKAPWNR